jgi:hypothetical protein
MLNLLNTLVENWSHLVVFKVKDADVAVTEIKGFLVSNDRCTTNTLITEMFNLPGFIRFEFHLIQVKDGQELIVTILSWSSWIHHFRNLGFQSLFLVFTDPLEVSDTTKYQNLVLVFQMSISKRF